MLISVIIPMYNEEMNVSETLRQVDTALSNLEEDYEIVVVDDGSRDDTPKLAKEAAAKNKRIRVVHHRTNMGLGEALKTGFRESKGDIMVTTDADLSYDPKDIPKLISKLDDADIVTGSCYMKGGEVKGVPHLRLLLSKIGNKIIAHSMSTDIHTVTSIFRAYRRKAIDPLILKSSGPEIMPEIIAKSSANGFRIKEIPSVLKSRTKGKSKFNPISGIKKHFMFSLYEKSATIISLFGVISILVGGLIASYLGMLYLKNALDSQRPLMAIMPLLMISGIQLIFFGLVATQITQIKKEIYKIQSSVRESKR